jgi:hypothetical protein
MQTDLINEGKKFAILKQAEAALEDICREHEISLMTYYGWNSKLGAPEPKSIGVMFVYTFLLLGAAFALGFSYYLEHSSLFWSHVFRDIGISGLVGFILAMTFERLSAEEFKRLTKKDRAAIKQDVFYYVLGYYLPSRIRNEITSQIVSSPFLRQSCVMDVELQIISDPCTGRNYMKTICKLWYEVVNLTPEMRTWSFGPYVDKAPVPSLAHETKFTRIKIEGAETPIDLDEQALQKPEHRKEDLTGTTITLKLPGPVAVEKSAKVHYAYQTVRYLEAGHFQYVLSHHALDFQLMLRMIGPNIDPGIKIFVDADPAGLVPTLQHHPESHFYNWKIIRPLLPYQAIKVNWILKPATSRKNDQNNSAIAAETEAQTSGKQLSGDPSSTQIPTAG